MGFALARACREAGAVVTLVAGPVALPTPRGVVRKDVVSALDMRREVMAAVDGHDIFIGVAAVADYRPVESRPHKIKKGSGNMTLELAANPDILAEVAARPVRPFCVGFAAESQNLDEYAQGKRQAKRLPLVVGNLVQHGLGGETNQVCLYDDHGVHPVPPGDKLSVARAIVTHIAGMLS